MKWLVPCAFMVVAGGCFSGWKSDGPWACGADDACPDGLSCDDGVCCRPGGRPVCPTLPFEDSCPAGSTPKTYFHDADGDGVGSTESGRVFCRAPQRGGWVELDGDCNDADDTIGPRASERCNAIDDDCNGIIDDGLDNSRWYRDADGDSWGSDCQGCVLEACVRPDGYEARAGDCDDSAPNVYPGAPEYCNGIDDNCNGQLDDGPFVDVENPSDPNTMRFPCTTMLKGECSKGGMQCVYSPTSLRFEPGCVPLSPPRPEICGDGVDNDCDGETDQPPGCGGPPDLMNSPGVTMGAFVERDAGTALLATPTCAAGRGTEAMGWLRPSWIGTGWGEHVLWANAPEGLPWDLSGPGRALRLDVHTTSVGGQAPDGSSSPLWNYPGLQPSLVVQLCGADDHAVRRLVPLDAGVRLSSGRKELVVPLEGNPAWEATTYGAFSISSVKRVELLVAPRPFVDITFTNRFAEDGGLGFAP